MTADAILPAARSPSPTTGADDRLCRHLLRHVADHGLMQRSTSLFFYSAIVVLVLSMGAATFLSHQPQVQPLNKVAEAARRFGRGELDTRVEVPKSAAARDRRFPGQRLQHHGRLARKIEQRRQEFVANVSHELKTPMTTIGGYRRHARRDNPAGKQQHYMPDRLRRGAQALAARAQHARYRRSCRPWASKTAARPASTSAELSDVLITFEQKIYNKHLDVRVDSPDKPVWTGPSATASRRSSITSSKTRHQVLPLTAGGSLRVRSDGGKAACRSKIPARPSTRRSCRCSLTASTRRINPLRRPRGLGTRTVHYQTIVGAHGGDIWATSENGVTQFNFTLPLSGNSTEGLQTVQRLFKFPGYTIENRRVGMKRSVFKQEGV